MSGTALARRLTDLSQATTRRGTDLLSLGVRLVKGHTTCAFRQSLRNVLTEAKLMRLHRQGVRHARAVALPCKLHIGCGDNVKAGWVNIDLGRFADIRLDLREPLPFPDASATVIYSEHFFEHLSFEQGTGLLREAWRVLVPGGLISIGVPESGGMLRLYVSGDRERWLACRDRYHPKWCTSPMHSVNYHFRQDDEHRYAYDLETLAGALKDCRFVNIRERNWDASLDLDSRQLGTLYVDAERP